MSDVAADLLDAHLDEILRAPADRGSLELIVRRPDFGEREVVDEARFDPAVGLDGDMWHHRPTSSTPDRSPNPARQVTVMSARVAAALAGPRERWPLAGDQLYVDLDLTAANLPPGTRLRIGTALLEVSGSPHIGCAKFAARFGTEALRAVNARARRELNLRGINTRVVAAGVARTGDAVEVVRA